VRMTGTTRVAPPAGAYALDLPRGGRAGVAVLDHSGRKQREHAADRADLFDRLLTRVDEAAS
jgi:hypothetical protein